MSNTCKYERALFIFFVIVYLCPFVRRKKKLHDCVGLVEGWGTSGLLSVPCFLGHKKACGRMEESIFYRANTLISTNTLVFAFHIFIHFI